MKEATSGLLFCEPWKAKQFMHDIVLERLQLVLKHTNVIEERLGLVNNAEDFKSSPEGEILLDSLLTRLQAISENIKKIQKIDQRFFESQIKLDVTPIVRFRDLVSHHYELVNHEIIFMICTVEIPALKKAVEEFFK
jgi:uncharacterized protein with HEPN domain